MRSKSRLRIAYGVAVVALEAVVLAKLRAGLGLDAAPCLAGRVSNRTSVDGGTSSSLVGALSGDKAREGRNGDGSGGVEHDACERWRSGAVRRQQVFAKEQAGRAAAGLLRQCLPGCLWRRMRYQWQKCNTVWCVSVLWRWIIETRGSVGVAAGMDARYLYGAKQAGTIVVYWEAKGKL